MSDIHAEMMRCVYSSSDQPIAGWHFRLFGHGPDLRGIVVHIFDDIVNKFHCYPLVIIKSMTRDSRIDAGSVVQYSIN